MNEKLPAPCEACDGSGLRDGSECSACRGKGYRLFVNGNQIPGDQILGNQIRASAARQTAAPRNASVHCSAGSIAPAEPRPVHYLPARGFTQLTICR